ncbi:unnamed protein product [Ceratitis capitata]|nr:unnamed protein product [Ceratitis capitata]
MARSKNFECIARNIKSLFEEELEHTILVLPDVYILGYHPESKQGLEQMRTLLTLLLGAAVQCPNREIFIGRIKMLDVETQHAIVGLIKQVTEEQSLVLTKESVNLLTPINMYNHILRLSKDRDAIYLRWISTMYTESDLNMSACGDDTLNIPSSPLSSAMSSSCLSDNNKAVEIADLKSKLRRLRQELEEKTEAILELRDEAQHKKAIYDNLRTESQEWYAEAKRALVYRDELDVLRERAERADYLEIEIQKLKEKLADAEFYKTRVEELREDNRMLLETKEMLEEQLQRARKRSEHVMTLESEIIKYKQKINDMSLERNAERSKLEELLEENTQLQLANKNLNTSHKIDSAFSEDDVNSGDNSLSEQLTNDSQTRIIKLELKNKQLTAALEKIKEESFHESANKILELEKDKKKLSLKVDQLEENIQRLTQQNTDLENIFKSALEENKKLQDTMDDRQKSYEHQSQEHEFERTKFKDLEQHVESLNKEKQNLQTLNESIQRRADDLARLLEMRAKEIEQLKERSQEVSKVKEQVFDLEARLSTRERENSGLLKDILKLKQDSEEKSVQLDECTEKFEAQTKELELLSQELIDVGPLQQRVAELEIQNQNLLSQRDIDLETIAALRNDIVSGTLATNKVSKVRQNLEKLGLGGSDQDDGNDELNVETVVEKLVRNPETFKTVREIMLNVSKEQCQNSKSNMCVLCHRKEIYTVEKNIEISSNNEPQELSFEHIITLNPQNSLDDTEMVRLQKANADLNTRYAVLQSANMRLEAERVKFDVDMVALGSQITSLNTQLIALQVANSQLASDKDQLIKQFESIKQENINLQHDLLALKALHDQLSTEYESIANNKEQIRMMLRECRNESRDLRGNITKYEEKIEVLAKENEALKRCSADLSILRTEHSKLTDDFRNLFRFKNEYKNIQEQYKMMRADNSKLKRQNAELMREVDSRSDLVRAIETDTTYYAQQCEILLQTNVHLDIDRKTLMENVSQLLSQYHELLSHSLEDKQHFREEEKSYTERLHNLSRQKEKLEEKIMEHYKKPEVIIPKKKPFASSIVRRVKKAGSDFINKVPTSRNRRSWIDESRLTQSQFTIGSDGNDSDNSTEAPISIASDTHLLQRNLPMRQSLQRDLMDNTLSRGGVRSSLQAQKRTDLNSSRRNSVHGLEAPDVTGSSLTLGTAGSRRTVYLIDEHQKIPESNSSSNDIGVSSHLSTSNSPLNTSAYSTSTNLPGDTYLEGSGASAAEPQTPTNLTPIPQADNPTTFLMYNRINTTIGGSTSAENNVSAGTSRDSTLTPNNSSSTTIGATPDDKLRKRTDDKSNSIWYEYGCV